MDGMKMNGENTIIPRACVRQITGIHSREKSPLFTHAFRKESFIQLL